MMIGLDPSIEKHRKGMSVMYDGKALASEKVIDVSKSDAGSFYTIDEGEEGEQENDKPNAAASVLTAAKEMLKKSPTKHTEEKKINESSSMSSIHSTTSGKHFIGGIVPPSVLAAAPSSSSISSSSSHPSEANGSLRKIHNRTPVVVKQKDFMNWLGEDYTSALSILKPINNDDYDFHPVSPEIGKVSNDNKNILEVCNHKENDIPLFPNLF